MRVGDAVYRVPLGVLNSMMKVRARQEAGEDVSVETDSWMLELLQLLQMDADSAAMEHEEAILFGA